MKTYALSEDLYSYVLKHCDLAHPCLTELAERTRSLPMGGMQISPDQGSVMHWLTRVLGVKNALEIGCFTGYSAICVAAALPADGRLITLDIDEASTAVAQEFFIKAGIADKIELRLAPAIDTLKEMAKTGFVEHFDLAFVDVDKLNYSRYFELCLRLLRVGGVLIVDNVLWGGNVINAEATDEATLAIRDFNEKIRSERRIDRCMLHIADGLLMLRKK